MKGIITLCGSVRFEDLFRRVNSELTLAGYAVLSVGCFDHERLHRPDLNAEVTKTGLDRLHCEKIEMSDAIVVLNRDRYVGISTSREMEYAKKAGKGIYYFEGEPNYDDLLNVTEAFKLTSSKRGR